MSKKSWAGSPCLDFCWGKPAAAVCQLATDGGPAAAQLLQQGEDFLLNAVVYKSIKPGWNTISSACPTSLGSVVSCLYSVRALRAGALGTYFTLMALLPPSPTSSSLAIKQALTLQKAEFKALTPQDPKLSASPCFMAPASRVLSLQRDKGTGWRLRLKMEAPRTGAHPPCPSGAIK